METKNYFKELDNLNQSLTSNVIANKYNYEKLGIAKSQRLTFRRKIRKLVTSVYENVDSLTEKELKQFTDFQLNALIAGTNKKFGELKVSDVYPSFEKLTEKEKEQLTIAHKKIISKISEKEKEIKK